MKRLLKGGHLVDPTQGIDGVRDVLLDGDRVAAVGQDLPADPGVEVIEVPAGLRGLSRLRGHARPPARAGAGAQGDDRQRHRGGGGRRLHGRRLHAEHPAGERQRRRHARDPRAGRARRRGARLPDRRRVEGHEGREPLRDRRPAGRRLRGRLRRREAGGDGAADAAGARVRRHVRHAGDRPLRGADAQGRGRGARGLRRLDARPARHPGDRRVDHGRARHRARRDDRQRRSTSRTSARARRCAAYGRGQGARPQGDVRGDAAPLRADRRAAGRPDELRHQPQDEPAAPGAGRRRRRAAGAAGRDRRRHRHRPRAAPAGREGTWSSTGRRSASSASRPPCR